MNKMTKGTLFGFVALMLVTASACGNSGNAGNNADAGTNGTNAGANSTNAGNDGTAAEEPLKIKIMANNEQATMSESDKKWIAQVEKDMNVKLEFEIPPVSGYQERVQLMLASGDYPDLVYFPATNDQSFLSAVKDGLVVPVNDYIKNDPEIMKYTYDVSWNALKVQQDDKIYGIPRTTVIRNDAFWMRKDWLKNVGVTIPDDSEITIDQFTDILRKFTKNDPDGNGKDDTYGYAAYSDPDKVLQPILTSQFGELGWQKSEGGEYGYIDAKYDRSSDAFKKSLAYTGMLSKEGLLDPDSAVNNSTTSRERFIRGITGVLQGFAGHYGYHGADLKKANPNADITYVFVKNEKDGKVAGSGYGVGLWGFWGLTKTAKDPQKVIDVLNYYLKDNEYPSVLNGYEGIDYTKQGDKLVDAESKQPAPVRLNTMRRAGDTQIYFPLTTPQEIIDMSKPWLEKSVSSVVLTKDLGFTPEAAKKPDYMDYKKKWDQTIMKIDLGQASVDEFDGLLDGWYKNGGEEYMKQMNDFIAKTDKG